MSHIISISHIQWCHHLSSQYRRKFQGANKERNRFTSQVFKVPAGIGLTILGGSAVANINHRAIDKDAGKR